MEDERIVGGASLRRVDARARRRIQPVCTEPVDRLRWKRDKRTTADDCGGTRKACGRCRAKDLRVHAVPPLMKNLCSAKHG